ncbi:binding-protein-dependent transport systems inner membrane component [Candidatus Vecturithrix granuli]|uniref:Binding-protein-dependent transport systems inner membrane component n=1 Tax=Vecturithrix granuli TaxID=1499967 RepID=A0A081BZ33_VECG1|nr:binding-protein-dependent transport systems inner membrane component [Candidatus Vecturithrix granuli]
MKLFSSSRRNEVLVLYALMLPGLLYFLLFRIIPLLGTLVAFKDVAPFQGLEAIITAPWVGFKHFQKFMSSHFFWNILGNTFILAGLRMIFEFGLPIVLALLINEVINVYFKKSVQTISYMPYFISNVVLAGMVFNLLSLHGGLVPEVIRFFGGQPEYYVGKASTFRIVLVAAIVWKNVGWGSIIYLAALSGIDPELYEAAELDGANRWQQTIHITLPGISFAIAIMFLLRISVVLNQGYEETLLLYSPPVYKVADIIDTYVFRIGLQQLNYSFAAAVGLFKSFLALGLVWGSNWVTKKLGHESLYS